MTPTVTINNFIPFASVLLGGGLGVYLFIQLVKNVCARFGWSSSHLIHILVVAASFGVAAAQYVLTLKGMPKEIIGVSWVSIYGFSQGVYNEAKIIGNFLNQVQTTYNAGKQSLAAASAVVSPTISQPAEPVAAPEFSN